ncbi:hypothetical protein BC831DRAFT_512372 [Entophlyctis helioformis]|nr:hypothetical protein BC831DRAFT_512372 [Entophlyctis helioformis]
MRKAANAASSARGRGAGGQTAKAAGADVLADSGLLGLAPEKLERNLYVQSRIAEVSQHGSPKRTVAHLRRLRSTEGSLAADVDLYAIDESFAPYPVCTGLTTIGSATDGSVDIILVSTGVSGLHALIEVSPNGDEHFVEDLDSTNGSNIGDSQYKLTPRRLYQLTHNKLISFGPISFRYEFVRPRSSIDGLSRDEIRAALDVDHDSQAPHSLDAQPTTTPSKSTMLENGNYKGDIEDGARSETTQEIAPSDGEAAKEGDMDGMASPSGAVQAPGYTHRYTPSASKDLFDYLPLIGEIPATTQSLMAPLSPQLVDDVIMDDIRDQFAADNRNAASDLGLDFADESKIEMDSDIFGTDTGRIATIEPMPNSNRVRRTLVKRASGDEVDFDTIKPMSAPSSPKAATKGTGIAVGDTDDADPFAFPPAGVKAGPVAKAKRGSKAAAAVSETLHQEPGRRPTKRSVEASSKTDKAASKKPKRGAASAKRGAASDAVVDDSQDELMEGPPLRVAASESLTPPFATADPLQTGGDAAEVTPKQAGKAAQKHGKAVKEKETKSVKTPKTPKGQKAKEMSADAGNGHAAGSEGEVRVLFTGMDDEDHRQIVEALGGTVVDNWSECTHLVTDRIRRTVKFLCALSAGKHIMDVKWLDVSKKEGRFADEGKHVLKDPKTEKTFKFNLRKTLGVVQAPDAALLFDGRKVFSTPSVRPAHDELKEILSAAGGTLVANRDGVDKDTIIIGNAADADLCTELRQQGHTVYSIEIVLTEMLKANSVADLKTFWEDVGRQTRSSTAPKPRPLAADDDVETIAFALKTLEVNSVKVHEIEFRCLTCQSAFVLRAAHECEALKQAFESHASTHLQASHAHVTSVNAHSSNDDGKDGRAAGRGRNTDKMFEMRDDPYNEKQGIEWLRDTTRDHVNMII